MPFLADRMEMALRSIVMGKPLSTSQTHCVFGLSLGLVLMVNDEIDLGPVVIDSQLQKTRADEVIINSYIRKFGLN